MAHANASRPSHLRGSRGKTAQTTGKAEGEDKEKEDKDAKAEGGEGEEKEKEKSDAKAEGGEGDDKEKSDAKAEDGEEEEDDDEDAGGDSPAAKATAERKRIAGILNHSAAEGREALAKHLAFETGMSVDEAGKVLQASPKGAAKGQLSSAMQQLGSTVVGSETKGGADAEAAAASRIASYVTGRKSK